MPKSRTHYPQVPVEIAKKIAEAESSGQKIKTVKHPKKSPNGNAPDEPQRG